MVCFKDFKNVIITYLSALKVWRGINHLVKKFLF